MEAAHAFLFLQSYPGGLKFHLCVCTLRQKPLHSLEAVNLDWGTQKFLKLPKPHDTRMPRLSDSTVMSLYLKSDGANGYFPGMGQKPNLWMMKWRLIRIVQQNVLLMCQFWDP